MSTSSFAFPTKVEDSGVRQRSLALLRQKGVRLPSFAELAEPRLAPEAVRRSLASIGPDDPHPGNLYRVHWYNDLSRRGQVAVPVHVELPEALTGVKARIVVALGALFPMISRPQGARRLWLPRAAPRDRPLRPDAPARGLAVDRAITAAAASPSRASSAAAASRCCRPA